MTELLEEHLISQGVTPLVLNLRDYIKVKDFPEEGDDVITADNMEILRNILDQADLLFIGTYTWNFGDLSDEFNKAIHEYNLLTPLYPNAYLNAAVYGTGETQFGQENFCAAVNKISDVLREYYGYEARTFKHEHMMISNTEQHENFTDWIDEVLAHGVRYHGITSPDFTRGTISV